jgi:hypothetical protein
MPAAPFHNFECDYGATFDETVLWRDKDTGQPVDLTDFKALMQLRTAPGRPIVMELSDDNNKIVLGGTAGTIQMKLRNADTRIPPRAYRTDLRLWVPAGDTEDDEVEFLFKCAFVINPTISEPA